MKYACAECNVECPSMQGKCPTCGSIRVVLASILEGHVRLWSLAEVAQVRAELTDGDLEALGVTDRARSGDFESILHKGLATIEIGIIVPTMLGFALRGDRKPLT